MRRIPRPLGLLLAISLVTSFAWAVLLPPLQGPDELSHFSYTQRLVEARQLPGRVQIPGRIYSSSEVNAPVSWGQLGQLIANPGARPAWTKLEEARWLGTEGGRRDDGIGASPAANNPPLFYAYEALPYEVFSAGSFVDRLYAMRVADILFGLLTVAFTWLLAGELVGRVRWLQTLAAGSVALFPMLEQQAGLDAPDAALAAIWTAFLWVAVKLVREGFTRGRLISLFVLVGASVLAHPRGFPILVPAALTLVLAQRRHRPAIPRAVWIGGSVLLALGIAAAGVLLVTRRNTLPVIGHSAQPLELREFFSYLWQFYLPRLGFMNLTVGSPLAVEPVFIRTFFGAFAWQEVQWPEAVYAVLKWASLAGLVGLVGALWARRSQVRRHLDVLAVLLATILPLLLMLHAADYWGYLNSAGPVITGRNLFPLIGLFGCAIALVVSALPRRIGPYAAALLLGAGSVMAVSALTLTAVRFYA